MMKPFSSTPASSLVRLFLCIAAFSTLASAQQEIHQPTAPARTSRYLDHSPLFYEFLIPNPPAPGGKLADEDLAAVHLAQARRTPAEIESAQHDDQEESIFAFASVFGPRFNAVDLPLTAAFSRHLREESGVVNPALKIAFQRARPFIADATVKPVCERTASNSYPSGHAMVGYLEGFALAQMIPEKADAILTRAVAYAQNRVICGVHYPTDIEASRVVAAAIFASISTSPIFQQEANAARDELRRKLLESH